MDETTTTTMTATPVLHPHPEWKRLYKALVPLLEHNREFGYDELSALAGVDVCSSQGRAQFHRCAREIPRNHRFHFENMVTQGYRLVAPKEHAMHGARQLEFARRRAARGLAIMLYTQVELLDDQQRAAHADVEARIGRASVYLEDHTRQVQQIAARVSDLPKPMLEG